MSRTYTATRPRGLASWSPRHKTRALLAQVDEVLAEYRDHLPLTCRQVFYRLVGRYGYPKDERAYERLLETLNRARRAGLVSFSSIRDDGTTQESAGGFSGTAAFWEAVQSAAAHYHRRLLDHQPLALEVWVEAAGMVPQVARVVHPYGVPVFSSGGFDSLTAKYQAARRALIRPTVILSIGDHDPSGWALFDSVEADVAAMVRDLGGAHPVCFERVAVTAEQVERFGLTTYPAKKTDRRGGWDGPTCQCEALDPADLAAVLDRAVRQHIDEGAMREARTLQEKERGQLLETLERLA